MPNPDNQLVELAGEITKAALTNSNKNLIDSADDVAKFYETIYRKIRELKYAVTGKP